jgi:uncharacterized protein YxeA
MGVIKMKKIVLALMALVLLSNVAVAAKVIYEDSVVNCHNTYVIMEWNVETSDGRIIQGMTYVAPETKVTVTIYDEGIVELVREKANCGGQQKGHSSLEYPDYAEI